MSCACGLGSTRFAWMAGLLPSRLPLRLAAEFLLGFFRHWAPPNRKQATHSEEAAARFHDPHPNAAEWADFRTYPSLNALYDAYVGRIKKEFDGKFQPNHLNCWLSKWSGEVSWNHNGSHSLKFTIAQMRRGDPLNEDTQAAGRVYCGTTQGVQHIIWTQNAGHLLAEVRGTPAPETFAWWHTVHHYIGALRMSMH